MKQLVLSAMMCLTTLFAQAQVMTSATIDKVYATVAVDSSSEYFYNASYDDNGRITTMTVYEEWPGQRGVTRLDPVCQYHYDYAVDGLLTSRTTYLWKKGEWKCAAQHTYTLTTDSYIASYSRWNRKSGAFDQATEQIVYSLLPNETVSHVSYYQRDRHSDDLLLSWQMPVEDMSSDMLLTQK